MFLICSKGFNIDFRNRKWNYPNRKWNYFSHFQASDQKNSFTKCFSLDLRSSNSILKSGNGIILTGKGIIFFTFRPLIKKLHFHNVCHFCLFSHIFNFFQLFELFWTIFTYLDLHESFAAYSIVMLVICRYCSFYL